MSKDQLSLLIYIKNMLADLIYLNGIIATEIVKITENSAGIRRGEDFMKNSKCIPEHYDLSKRVVEIVKKYKMNTEDYEFLKKHVIEHPK